MGLADLVADVRGQNGTYLVTAKANSDYGAIAANVAVATGKQLAIDLRPGTAFSGIGFTGHIVQAGGAFAGTVQANGSGVAGHIDLSAQGGKQRAVVALAAANTSLPGKAGLTVERALVNADVLMTDQPQIKGDVQLSGTRMGDLYIAIARANVDYHAGAGQAKMLVEGRSKYPFHLAANAAWRRSCGGWRCRARSMAWTSPAARRCRSCRTRAPILCVRPRCRSAMARSSLRAIMATAWRCTAG
jgi:translocation and assembly module TamB